VSVEAQMANVLPFGQTQLRKPQNLLRGTRTAETVR